MQLVLLPGMDGTGRLFAPLLQALQANIDCRVISYPFTGGQDYAHLTRLVQAQLPFSPYIILAESFSGPIAHLLAQQRPTGLKGIIFAASFLQNPNPRLLALAKILIRFGFMKLTPPNFLVRHLMLGPDATQEQIDLFLQVLRSIPVDVLMQRLKSISDLTFSACRTDLPLTYIQPQRDRLVRHWNVQSFYRIQPDLIVAPVDGPHFILQARANDCAIVIRTFISAL